MTLRMQQTILITTLFLGLACPAGFTRAADDVDLAALFPEDALVYVERAGEQRTSRAAKDTAFGALMAEPAVERFTNQLWSAIDAFITEQIGESKEQRSAYAAGKQLLRTLMDRPVAFAILDGGMGDEGPFIHAAIICQAGEHADKMLDRFEDILKAGGMAETQTATVAGKPFKQLAAPVPGGAFYGVVEGHFILAVSQMTVEKIVARLGNDIDDSTLGSNKKLVHSRKKIGGDAQTRSMTVFVDVAGLLEKAKAIMPVLMGGDAEQIDKATSIMSTLGIDGVKSICWESHQREIGCFGGFYVYAPGDKSHESSDSDKTLTDRDLAVIPKFPSWAMAYNVELAGMYRKLLSAVTSIDPSIDSDVTEGIKGVEETLGFSLDKEFLELIGDTVVVYDAKENGGILITGVTVIAESREPDQLADRLEKIVGVIRESVGGESVRLATTKHREHSVRFVNVVGFPVPVAPAWAVHDKWLIVGLYPQMVVTALDRLMDGDPEKDSILANPDFVAARKVLGKPGWGMSFVDTRGAVNAVYPFLLPFAQAGAAMAQGKGVDVDISALPPLASITRHLFADVKMVRSEEDGVLHASYGPLPVGLGSLWAGNLSTSAMAVSILLPSLSRAREMAKRTVCAANLRGIGEAMYIYAQDKGKLPPDFEALIEDNLIVPKMLNCPSSGADPEDLHACFEYIPGQSLLGDPTNVLVYEKRGTHGEEGGNVLFVDSHVEFVKPYSRVEELVEETRGKLVKKKKGPQEDEP